jgi:hypothetical protein
MTSINDAKISHGRLAELGERAANLHEWEARAGMAILRSPQDILDDVDCVRVLAHSSESLTVYDPGLGVRTIYEQTIPIVDVSDPFTFGYLFSLCELLDDTAANKVYKLLDVGDLECSAHVILCELENRLPF